LKAQSAKNVIEVSKNFYFFPKTPQIIIPNYWVGLNYTHLFNNQINSIRFTYDMDYYWNSIDNSVGKDNKREFYIFDFEYGKKVFSKKRITWNNGISFRYGSQNTVGSIINQGGWHEIVTTGHRLAFDAGLCSSLQYIYQPIKHLTVGSTIKMQLYYLTSHIHFSTTLGIGYAF
jgi:hypothetical protein